jgi:DNA-binding response OmpR family regulator
VNPFFLPSDEDGWRKAVAHQPDLILLDICMPKLDRLHLCRLLKDDPRTMEIPVLFLTGRVAPVDRLAGFGAGASDYITKPCHADELAARLRVHQDIRRRLRALAAPPPAGQQPVEPRAALNSAPAPAGSAGPSRDDRVIERAVAALRADLAEPPMLTELARRIGTNERTLTELLRRRFGRPVFAWLREERFGRACDSSAQRVAEVLPGIEQLPLGRYMAWLLDPGHALAAPSALASPDWQQVHGSSLNLGFRDETLWVRLRLHNPGPEALERWLRLEPPHLEWVRLFLEGPDGSALPMT